MLYNKNNVRKTNDKKILHKVGKQWKVISVALLMAIGGGAAVATHANAQSNNNVNASTSAEVAALEQKPAVASATSVAPSSATKSASASAKPASSVSYMNDNGGSAASYHAKASNDNAQYKVNNALVQSYVSSLNAVFPSATNSLNDAYNSAATKTNADKAAAQSYSDVAANKNYSSQVSTLASKAGLTYSGFVQSVSYAASNFASEVSNDSNAASQMSVVNSYAQLISEVNANDGNNALHYGYQAKFASASDAEEIARDYANNTSAVRNNLLAESENNDAELSDATKESLTNSAAENIAHINSGIDAYTTNSLAKSLGYTNTSSSTSSNNSMNANELSVVLDHGNAPYDMADGGSKLVPVRKYNNPRNDAEVYANNMYVVLNDTAEMQRYNSVSASDTSVMASATNAKASLSAAITSANSAYQSYSNEADSASANVNAYSVLAGNPTLSNLFANVAYVGTNNAKTNEAKAIINSAKQYFGVNAVKDAYNLVKNANIVTAKNVVKVANNLPTDNTEDAKATNDIKRVLTPSNINTALNDNPEYNAKVANAVKAVKDAQQGNSQAKDFVNAKFNKVLGLLPKAGNVHHVSDLLNAMRAHSAKGEQEANEIQNNPQAMGIANALVNDFKGSNGAMDTSKVANYLNLAKAGLLKNASKGVESKAGRNNASVRMTLNDAYKIVAADKYVKDHANSKVLFGGILDPTSYSAAKDDMDAANAYVSTSSVTSLANSAAATFSKTQSASNSYSAATEENVTLAGIYATSYSNDATSDEAVESNAKNSLDDFYTNHADASYASASAAAASDASAEPNDAALAKANGVNVFNYAPKYITVVKNCGLYRNTDFAKKAHMMTVPAGTQLKVTGVGFSINGRTRYTVNYNGHNGYVTSWSGYVQQTYLPTQNNVSVTVTKDSKIYNSAKFTNKSYVGKTLKAGTVLPNVNVVSYDNVYGGVSRLETPSGKFVSANIAYASLNGEADNGNTNTNTVTPSHNGVVSYWN